MHKTLVVALAALAAVALGAQQPPAPEAGARAQDPWSTGTFTDLRLRAVGPALMSGRVAAIAVHPEDKQTWYIGVASGGVWKTTNAGITFTPVFQNEASYSIGAVVIDAKQPNTIWVGTGEANNQRSVGYGDGVYRSDDGGKSWKNLGLKTSEQIGRIVDRPARLERRVRRGLRPAVVRGRRARTLQDHRRRRPPGPRCSRSARTPASATSRSTRVIRT